MLDTLKLAHDMLIQIENGKSFSQHEWDDNLARIELQLKLKTARAIWLQHNINAGQATP